MMKMCRVLFKMIFLEGGGGNFKITVHACHTRRDHIFDVCIVSM